MKTNTKTSMRDPTHASAVARAADEFLDLLDRGVAPDVESFVARYPEAADLLRRILPALQALGTDVADSGLDALDTAHESSPGRRCLGDFQLLREIGRGGMGVVYEARQLSLDRLVALKILPLAAVLDQRQLQRFQNEARAAAHLRHPNILPIFSVGCERGVHYYAMQLIDGPTLAEVVRHLHAQQDPAPGGRPAHVSRAGLPAVSGSSARGLAGTPPAGFDAGTFASRTSLDARETGRFDAASAVGLPAAPRSLPAVLTSSLGESTTSRAFFRAVAQLGIQAASALQHAHEEGIIHRDIKPSNLLLDSQGKLWIADFGLARVEQDPGITMTGDVLGTLRYMSPEQASAERGAVDHHTDIYSLGAALYEVLALRPAFPAHNRQELLRQITSEEPTPLRQINSAIPSEIETIVGKAMAKAPAERYGTIQEVADDLQRYLDARPIRAKRPTLRDRTCKWCRRHRKVLTAVGLTGLALLIAGGVLLWRERAQTLAALAQAQLGFQTTEDQRQRAEENFQQARDAVDRMLTQAAEKLADVPHMEHVRRALLEDALEFYQGFLEERSDDPTVRHDTASAYMRVAFIHKILGRPGLAVKSFDAAIGLLEDLAIDSPSIPEYLRDLGTAHFELAILLKNDVHDKQGALEFYERAFELRSKLAAEFPGETEYVRDLAHNHTDLGLILSDLGRYEEAITEFRQGGALREQLAASFPDVPEYRADLAHGLHWLASRLAILGQFTEAETHYRRCVALGEELAAAQPLAYGERLAHAKEYLARLLMATERSEEALQVTREAAVIREQLVTAFPGVPAATVNWTKSCVLLARSFLATDRPQEAVDVLRPFAARHARMPVSVHYVHDSPCLDLGGLLVEMGLSEEAKQVFSEDVAILEKSCADVPDQVATCEKLARLLVACPDPAFYDPARAAAFARQAIQLEPACGWCWNQLGKACYRLGDWQAALDAQEKSFELLGGRHPWGLFYLAMTHWQRGDARQAQSGYAEALRQAGHRNELQFGGEVYRLQIEAAELLGLDE